MHDEANNGIEDHVTMLNVQALATIDFLHLNKLLLVACLQALTMAYMDINRQARTVERVP